MRTNQLVLNAARELYIKHGGQNHREIEREMRALGCRTFSRRVLYNQKTKQGVRLGWIERYGWKAALRNADAPVRTDVASASAPTLASSSSPSPQLTPPPCHNVSAVDSSRPTANCQPPTSFPAWLKQISPNMAWDWPYQQLIYRQLHRIATGESKRLMIFLPPRHGKSELVTNRFAAWCLLQNPHMNIIIGSYNQRLANRFSRKVRITFEDALAASAGPPAASRPEKSSAPYEGGVEAVSTDGVVLSRSTYRQPPTATPQPLQPPRLGVSAVQSASRTRLNTVAEWETGLGGGLRAVGVGGGITGFGANLVIIDDPIKSRSEAESKTYRDRTYEWFNDDLYTRLEPDARIILIQTRWHEDDLAGRLLKEMSDGGENWEVISLPALAERNADAPVRMSAEHEKTPPTANCQPPTEITPRSPDPLGRAPGEPLCPDRFSKDDLLRIKKRLGSYSFSALYQQRPTPPEGGLFKRVWFTRIVDRPPEGLWWCRGYDLAVSTKDNADYTASFRCALDKQTGDLYIADGFRGRLEFPEQRRLIVQKIKDEPNTEHGIEQALHGQAFVQDLRREHRLFGRAFRGIKVSTDKFTRALSWANLAEDGKVVLVRGLWIDAFLDEVCSFPNSQHDDQLDAVSLAVEMLSRHTNRAHGF